MIEALTQPPLLHVYCDESRQTASEYMVLGGIIFPDSKKAKLDACVNNWRKKHNMNAELKWKKISSGKFAEYKELVDSLSFLARVGNCFHFRSLVIDRKKINYGKFHGGNKELGFYKFYYQLLLHKFGGYAAREPRRILIRLDRRETPYRLTDLHKILNLGIRKTYGCATGPVVAIEPIDSKSSNFLQIADILIGAVGYHCNGIHKSGGPDNGKVKMAQLIADSLGMKCLDVPCSKKWFQIWRFKMGA